MSELARSLAVLVEPPGPSTERIAALVGLPGTPEGWRYHEIFLQQLYPYASVYLGADGKIGGDAPLSAQGHAYAENLAAYVRGRFGASSDLDVFTSTLRRALETLPEDLPMAADVPGARPSTDRRWRVLSFSSFSRTARVDSSRTVSRRTPWTPRGSTRNGTSRRTSRTSTW